MSLKGVLAACVSEIHCLLQKRELVPWKTLSLLDLACEAPALWGLLKVLADCLWEEEGSYHVNQ